MHGYRDIFVRSSAYKDTRTPTLLQTKHVHAYIFAGEFYLHMHLFVDGVFLFIYLFICIVAIIINLPIKHAHMLCWLACVPVCVCALVPF